jgi:ATP-dependent helicase/nuclease subunit B
LILDSALVRGVARKLSSSAGQVSASRLEEYAKCPYYFFLKRVMNLEAWEEQGKSEGMDPLDKGLVVHSILERFLRSSGEKLFRTASNEELDQALEQIARPAIASARPGGIPDLLWEIEQDALIAVLRNWLSFEKDRKDPDMQVARLEQPFGDLTPNERYPTFRLNAGRHFFDFRGRIDRVDISSDGKRARVIDYKTGNLPQSMSGKARTPLMSGERIQIVVYRGALSVVEGFAGLEVIEGEYLHLQPRDGRVVPCAFSDAELQDALLALSRVLEIIGGGIEKGAFFARTSGTVWPSGHCEYCDYLPICGKDRIRREERKAADPAVQNFLRILETRQ